MRIKLYLRFDGACNLITPIILHLSLTQFIALENEEQSKNEICICRSSLCGHSYCSLFYYILSYKEIVSISNICDILQ